MSSEAATQLGVSHPFEEQQQADHDKKRAYVTWRRVEGPEAARDWRRYTLCGAGAKLMARWPPGPVFR